jgi:SAM-dependent methyltransferase
MMSQLARKSVLNVGCGGESLRIGSIFSPEKWEEIRLDIDPGNRPDIVCSIVDMRGVVGDGRFDALHCSHAIEHLYAHEVVPALREFLRVLKPNGFALISSPDLAAIARFMLSQGAEAIAYQSPAGPIRPIDMLFGHAESIAQGQVSMAHRTGFTAQRLARTALAAGFADVRILEGDSFDLWAALLAPGASVLEVAKHFAESGLARFFEDEKASPGTVAGRAPGGAFA